MDSVSGVGVVDKSVAILGCLADRGPSSLGELVEATGLPRPTAHRLAAALEVHGLVGRDASHRYRLGLRLVAWGGRAARTSPVVDAAGPVLERLRDRTGESAQLFVREADRRLCVAAAERPTGLRDSVPVGASLPVARGSGGKVLLAFGDPSRVPPEVPALELAAIRRRGWAASVGEREAGVASVSAPVRGSGGQLLASIGVSGPIDRLGRNPGRALSRVVVAAARELEERLPV